MRMRFQPSNNTEPIQTVTTIDGQETSITTNTGGYVWADEKAAFVVKSTSGTGNPSFEVLSGGFSGLTFSGTAMNQVWCSFHMDHDYALGTMIYPHVHWMPLTTVAGTVRWGFEYSIAKGHGQSAFFSDNYPIKYIDHTFPAGSRYKHMVTEFPEGEGIQTAEIEPDSVVFIRVFRDGGVDSYNGKVHAWQADIHYQIARVGTKNRAPNFFT